MEYRVLGPLEALGSEGTLPLGGAKQRALLAVLVLKAARSARATGPERKPRGLARATDRRAVGRRSAGHGGDERAGLRLAAAQAPARGVAADPRAGVRARGGARERRPAPVRAAFQRGSRRSWRGRS